MLKVTNVNRVNVSEEKKEEVKKKIFTGVFLFFFFVATSEVAFFPLLSFFHPKILLLSPTAATWWLQLQLAASTQEGPGGRRTGEWCGVVVYVPGLRQLEQAPVPAKSLRGTATPCRRRLTLRLVLRYRNFTCRLPRNLLARRPRGQGPGLPGKSSPRGE